MSKIGVIYSKEDGLDIGFESEESRELFTRYLKQMGQTPSKDVLVKVKADDKQTLEEIGKAKELVSLIERANSLADELAQTVGKLKLGFKVESV